MFKRKSAVTLPTVQLIQHQPVLVQVTSEFFEGKENPEKPNDKVADICNVKHYDLETGKFIKDGQMVVPTVVKANLEEWAEKNKASFVGEFFEITKGDKPQGKRYFKYEIWHMEQETETKPAEKPLKKAS